MLKKWVKKLFDVVEKLLPFFFSFHTRPKKADVVNSISDTIISFPSIAIVIQGPIVYEQDFTLETIKLYKKIFPQATIILSTWNYESAEYVARIKDDISEVLLNTVPLKKGTQNINFQIVSSQAGVVRAKELGAEYVLKTRTDQRIYGVNSLEFLWNVVRSFPVVPGYTQKNRIVGLSLNTFKYRRYGLSDMNIFGHVDDMMIYWSPDLDGQQEGQGMSALPLSVCEVYLSTSFLRTIGRVPTWTLEDSWRVFAEHFCVVDAQSLDIYWYKYARMKEYRYLRYDAMRNDQELNFKEWFNLYSNVENHTTDSSQKLLNVIPV